MIISGHNWDGSLANKDECMAMIFIMFVMGDAFVKLEPISVLNHWFYKLMEKNLSKSAATDFLVEYSALEALRVYFTYWFIKDISLDYPILYVIYALRLPELWNIFNLFEWTRNFESYEVFVKYL